MSRSYSTSLTPGLCGFPICSLPVTGLLNRYRHGVTEGAVNWETAWLPLENKQNKNDMRQSEGEREWGERRESERERERVKERKRREGEI